MNWIELDRQSQCLATVCKWWVVVEECFSGTVWMGVHWGGGGGQCYPEFDV